MRNCDVQIGKAYRARVGDRLTIVRIDRVYQYRTRTATRQGWVASEDGRAVRFPTAARILAEVGGPYAYDHEARRWVESRPE